MLKLFNLLKLANSTDLVSKTRIAAVATICSALFAVVSPMQSAHAEQVEIVKYAQSGNWAVYADSAGGCFSLTEYSRGTIIKIGFYERSGHLWPYMMVGGPRVSGAAEGEKYRTRAIFDNWNTFQGVSTGGHTAAGRAFLLMELAPEFVAAFAKHNEMTIEVDGSTVTSLPLPDTQAALVQTLTCQNELSAQATTSASQSTSSRSHTTGAALRRLKF